LVFCFCIFSRAYLAIRILHNGCDEGCIVDRDCSGGVVAYYGCRHAVIAAAAVAVVTIAEGEAEVIGFISGSYGSAECPDCAGRDRDELPVALPENLEIQGGCGRIGEDVAQKLQLDAGLLVFPGVYIQIHQGENRSQFGALRDGDRAIGAAFDPDIRGCLSGLLIASATYVGGTVLIFPHIVHSYYQIWRNTYSA